MRHFSRVWIGDPQGNVLVVEDMRGLWNFPGGKREEGETSLACAKREVLEEIGVQVGELQEIHTGIYEFSGEKWKGHFFMAGNVKGVPFIKEKNKFKKICYINKVDEVRFHEELLMDIHFLFEEVNASIPFLNRQEECLW